MKLADAATLVGVEIDETLLVEDADPVVCSIRMGRARGGKALRATVGERRATDRRSRPGGRIVPFRAHALREVPHVHRKRRRYRRIRYRQRPAIPLPRRIRGVVHILVSAVVAAIAPRPPPM